MKFNTKAIHVGQEPLKENGCVIPPIYQTSTYAQTSPAELIDGYDYTRAGNPNFTNLEATLAALEGGEYGVVFSSGLGAAMALLMQLQSGDHIVAVDDLYGGSYRLLTQLQKRMNLEISFVPGDDPQKWQDAITAKSKYFWIETPTNPLLNICDIAELASLARAKGIKSIVDNTFASPYLQNPLELGADVVLHSTTKYIGGHSDVIGGALICNDEKLAANLQFARMSYGLNPAPFDAWLVQRGVKTLGLRMDQHMRGASAIIESLQGNKLVEKLYYPGLASHANHNIAKQQMKGFGGMLSVLFNCEANKLKSSLAELKTFTLAESLGGVESLVCHPASMTHASIPQDIREARGIGETLVRFSVGIENVEDLLEDFAGFLKKLK